MELQIPLLQLYQAIQFSHDNTTVSAYLYSPNPNPTNSLAEPYKLHLP